MISLYDFFCFCFLNKGMRGMKKKKKKIKKDNNKKGKKKTIQAQEVN